jgi:hypothetical protein
MDKSSRKGNPFIILLFAISILIGVSLLPLSKLTNGWLQDYNLFSDIVESDTLIEDSIQDTIAETDYIEILDSLIAEDSAKSVCTHETINTDSNYIAVDTLINRRQGDKIII